MRYPLTIKITFIKEIHTMRFFRTIHLSKIFEEERPPFPFLKIYYNIVVRLNIALEEEIESLAFSLVSHMGRIIRRKKIKTKQQLEEDILVGNRDHSLNYMLKDKNIIEPNTRN